MKNRLQKRVPDRRGEADLGALALGVYVFDSKGDHLGGAQAGWVICLSSAFLGRLASTVAPAGVLLFGRQEA